MKHILSQNFWKACLQATLMLGFMVFISTATQAQATTSIQGQGADVIPEITIAQKLGITYFHPGTWDFVHVQSVLTQALESVTPGVNQGTATTNEKFKFFYYTLVLHDMNDYSIAPELSLIDNLAVALQRANIIKAAQQDIYNATIQLF